MDMDPETRRKLIDQYKDGYRVVAEALEGATEAELDAHPAPGKWSAREIVHHLADSEMTSAVRLRLLLATDAPVDRRATTRTSVARLSALRPAHRARRSTAFARRAAHDGRLSGPDERRPTGREKAPHSESGRYTTDTWLEIYAVHAHNHAAQIRRARAAAHGVRVYMNTWLTSASVVVLARGDAGCLAVGAMAAS